MDQLNNNPEVLILTIRDSERFIFKGIVNTISTYNDKGLFDVLPFHENFITSIKDKLIVRIQDTVKEYFIDKAIMKIESNIVNVYLIGDTKI